MNQVAPAALTGKLLGVIVLLATSTAPAPALTLKFDDLSSVGYPPIPEGYGGLNWNNFSVTDGNSQYVSSGYYNAMKSGPNVAFNVYGYVASITSPTPFTLGSGYFAAAWIDGLGLEVKGLVGTTVAFDHTYSLGPSQAIFINFNYVGVTEVDFIPVNPPPGTAPGTQFAMDNLTVMVPEPSSAQLMWGSAAVLLVLCRRRNRNAGGGRTDAEMRCSR